jgi:hypothetical protein
MCGKPGSYSSRNSARGDAALSMSKTADCECVSCRILQLGDHTWWFSRFRGTRIFMPQGTDSELNRVLQGILTEIGSKIVVVISMRPELFHAGVSC